MKRKPGKISLEDIKGVESYPEYLESEIRFYKQAKEKWAEDILKFLFHEGNNERKRILDAGSGIAVIPRAFIKIAQKKGLSIEVIGVDKSPLMNSFAQKKAEEEGLKGISFLEEDVLNMSFPDNYFDLVTASFLFFFLDEQELPKFFEEVYRVLKPRGKFYFLHAPRNRAMCWITYLFTRGRKKYELATIEHSYTRAETEALINQSALSSGNSFVVRRKWGGLILEAFGTVNKTSSK